MVQQILLGSARPTGQKAGSPFPRSMKSPKLSGYLFCLLAFAGLGPCRALAKTVDVTAYGAVGDGSTDNTTAIQSAINAAAAGDTVYFPGGTYNVSATISLLSNLTYAGEFAGTVRSIINQTAANHFTLELQSTASNITLNGITLQGNGLAVDKGSTAAQNLTIQNCTFQNITTGTYPTNQVIFISVGANNCNIIGNTFTNFVDTGILAWGLHGCMIADNSFNTFNEGSHINGTCTNVTYARNVGVNLRRMGIEIQGSGFQNLLVEDNAFANWLSPGTSSFGLSVVPSSGPNVITQYNTLIGIPPIAGGSTGSNHYGDGLEVGGDQVAQQNFVAGYWGCGVVIGGGNVTVANNILWGPSGTSQNPAQIQFEPGGNSANTVLTGNNLVNTPNFVGAPSSLQATPTSGNLVQLSWVNNTPSPTGLRVQRRLPGGMYYTIATLAPTATSYTDTAATSNMQYIYRLYAYDSGGDETYSPALLAGARKFEAENLTVVNYLSQAGGTARALGADANCSNGNGEILDSNTIGDYLTFLVPNVTAGVYDVRVGVKNFYARGQFQLQIGRADSFGSSAMNLGGAVDEYAPNAQYLEIDLGTWSPISSNDKWFRFNVVGKNSASGGSAYTTSLAFDYIKLVPAGALGGTLNGSVGAVTTSNYNLTALGTSDWAHWNGAYVHKSTGGSQISNVTQIGGGAYGSATQTARNVSWTDGAPTTSDSDDQAYITCKNKQNAGWTFTVPANTTPHTLKILYGGASAGSPGVTLSAHLSDSSAPDFSNTQTITSATLNEATFTFNSASNDQTLTITLVKSNNADGNSVDLDAAWLQ